MYRKLTKSLFVAALLVSGSAAMAIDEPDYEVLLIKGNIEFRQYEQHEDFPRIVAVRQISERRSDDTTRKQAQQLLNDLDSLSVDVVGKPILVRYDTPLAPRLMRGNEIVVPVEWSAEATPVLIAAEVSARL